MQLYNFQKDAVDAFIKNKNLKFLCFEMGLGKTATALHIARELGYLNTLIVCPASLQLTWVAEIEKWGFDSDLFDIISYGKLGGIIKVYDFIIFDESHYLKNNKSKRTQNAKRIVDCSKRVLLLTGTPVPNRPIELFPQLQIAGAPLAEMGYFDFASKYCAAHKTRFGWDYSGASNLKNLADNLKFIMYSATKKQVLKELPEKTIQHIYIKTKMSDLNKQVGEITEKTLTDTSPHIATARKEAGIRKVAAAVKYITDILEEDRKVVVFAHHIQVIEALKEGLDKFNPVSVYGRTTIANRQLAVASFQNLPETRVFIGQIQTAGVGFTLTSAAVAVFVEADWVPGNNKQAEDRIHRIGQTENVLVQYLTVKNSFDEKILKILDKKSKVISEITLVDKHKQKDIAHACLAPSAAARWITCTASVQANLNYDRVDNPAAKAGRQGHEWAEKLLRGQILPGEIPTKMRKCILTYVNYVSDLSRNSEYFGIEEKLKIESEWLANCYGTADALIVKNGTLHVIDLKLGRRGYVAVADNAQLKIYAFLAYARYYKKYKINSVTLTIVQPTIADTDHIRCETLPLNALLSFGKQLKEVILNILSNKTSFEIGDHCKWCAHKINCETYLTKR